MYDVPREIEWDGLRLLFKSEDSEDAVREAEGECQCDVDAGEGKDAEVVAARDGVVGVQETVHVSMLQVEHAEDLG